MPTDISDFKTVVGPTRDSIEIRLHSDSTTDARQLQQAAPGGAFELFRIVGKGGFGEVWEGIQNSLGRVIAIKRMRDDLFESTVEDSMFSMQYEMSFRQEALTTGCLEHPNIVPVYDYGLDNEGRPVLAMKMVRGTPWNRMIWEDFDQPIEEFLGKHLPILISVSQAVAFAHSRGFLHRDIKPSQVMVGEFGEVLLMDWGLGVVYDKELLRKSSGLVINFQDLPTLEDTLSPAGTVAFMAPEQTDDTPERVGTWTDVFLLGGTLYYLLTRTTPHPSEDTDEAFEQARKNTVEDPHLRAPDRKMPRELVDLCKRALTREPKERLASVVEWTDGLKSYMTGAHKRQQSMELIEEATDRSIACQNSGNYREMSECLSLVERARGLWPQNPRLQVIRETILAGYAKAAMDNHDLVLARVHAEMLQPSDERRELLNEVRAAEIHDHAQLRLFRLFMVGTVILLVIVSTMAVQLNKRAADALDAQEFANVEATNARQAQERAEVLLNFLVEDLHKGLAPLHRLDLLDQIASKTQEYYASLGEISPNETPDQKRRRALLMRNVASIQKGQGRLDKALESYQQYLGLVLELASNPNAVVVDRDLVVEGFHLTGETLILSGQIEQGLEYLKKAYEMLQSIIQEPDQDTSARRSRMADILTMVADIHYANGNLYQAISSEQESLGIRQMLSDQDPGNLELLGNIVENQANLARFLYLNGDNQAEEYLRAGEELLNTILLENPQNPAWLSTKARLLETKGRYATDYGNLSLAQESLDRSSAISRQLTSIDPTNGEWQRAAAELHVAQAALESRRGKTQSAIEQTRTALKTLKALTDQDSLNIIWQASLGEAYRLLGHYLIENDEPNEALDELALSRQVFSQLRDREPNLQIWETALGAITLEQGNAYVQRGQHQRARELIENTLGEFEKLEQDQPLNRRVQFIQIHGMLRLGNLLESMGENATARQVWMDALEKGEGLFRPMNTLSTGELAVRAELFLHLDRLDEVVPMIEELKRREYVDPGFWSLCQEKNIPVE